MILTKNGNPLPLSGNRSRYPLSDVPPVRAPSAPSRKYLGIRAPLQGAGPRKGFVARQGRPFGHGGQAQERARRRTVSTPHKQATSTPDAARGSLVAAEKAALLATGACGEGTHRQPFV